MISGDAPNIGLYKIGGGTLVLSGANSYTGGTVISAGTLAIASDANLGAASGGLTLDGGTLHTTADIGTSRSLTLASTGRLLTDAGTALTLTGPLSGAGSLDKDGSGDLIFAGAASYTGGTVISAGTLQIGNGGTSGSLAGNVANAGVLAFDRSDAAIFAGAVSGVGSLEQRGSGTTVLTGTNVYTGGTVISAGTLQIGNGGTSGSIVGNVANAGVLAFDRSDAAIFAGAVSGAGSLEQRGSGTTVLTGTNTYTGGTIISAGTLQIGDGATSGSIVGNVADAGVLAFNRSDATIFAGAVSGAGSLEQRGSGTTVLTGTNTYTGGTIISAGTLQIGDGATSGSIVGNVADAGVLAFNRSDATIFAGAVSGTGSLEQRGSGTTVLTGTNIYTGGTVISAGTLQIGDGGTSGSIAGDVANAGVLAFDRSDAAIFAGAVSGSGSLEQRGIGTTVLTGTNVYTGSTIISAGTLQIGNGGTSGSIVGDVTNAGVLAFDRSDVITFGGLISGAGSVQPGRQRCHGPHRDQYLCGRDNGCRWRFVHQWQPVDGNRSDHGQYGRNARRHWHDRWQRGGRRWRHTVAGRYRHDSRYPHDPAGSDPRQRVGARLQFWSGQCRGRSPQ